MIARHPVLAAAPSHETDHRRTIPAALGQPRWWSLDDDLVPILDDLRRAGWRFVLATIAAAEGGPRPAGTQMVFVEDRGWGSLSGGCLEADLVCHAREALADGSLRRLIYGRGSPWLDIRLACGARLEVLLEPMPPDDPALAELLALAGRRELARYVSNGERRLCCPAGQEIPGHWPADALYTPAQRLVVVGLDPFAHAIAEAGRHMDWSVRQVADLSGLQDLGGWEFDPWTAVAVASHDTECDHAALGFALRSRAGYVGVLGSRGRFPARLEKLRENGID